MAKQFKYALGSRVRDHVTGLEGVIVSACEHISGCLTYYVQPPVRDNGEVPKVHYVLEGRIELLKSEPNAPAYPPFMYPLGLKAEDRVTGFKGILVIRVHHLGSVDSYWLDASCQKDGKMPDGHFDEPRLKVTGRKSVMGEPPANAMVG